MYLVGHVLTIFIKDQLFYLIYLIAFCQFLNFVCEIDIFFYLLTQSIDKTNVFSREDFTFVFEISLKLYLTFNWIFRGLILLSLDNLSGVRNQLLNFEIISSISKFPLEIIYSYIFLWLKFNLALLVLLLFSLFEKLFNIGQACFNIRVNLTCFLLK